MGMLVVMVLRIQTCPLLFLLVLINVSLKEEHNPRTLFVLLKAKGVFLA